MKCTKCTKVIYLAERIEVLIKEKKHFFHRSCFRCSDCGIQLTVENFGSLDAQIYCGVHLKTHLPTQAKSDSAYFLSPLSNPSTYIPQHSFLEVQSGEKEATDSNGMQSVNPEVIEKPNNIKTAKEVETQDLTQDLKRDEIREQRRMQREKERQEEEKKEVEARQRREKEREERRRRREEVQS